MMHKEPSKEQLNKVNALINRIMSEIEFDGGETEGSKELVRFLDEIGVTNDFSVQGGRSLVESLAFLNAYQVIDKLCANGFRCIGFNSCAIIEASKAGGYQAIDILVRHGWDVNHADYQGKTPLMHSLFATEGRLETVEALLRNNADIDRQYHSGVTSKDHVGLTVLDMAMNGDDRDVVDLICRFVESKSEHQTLKSTIKEANDKEEGILNF